MATNLQATVRELASVFADRLLQTIRTSSLEEILSQAKGITIKRGPGRPAKGNGAPAVVVRSNAPRAKVKNGRLARRSPSDIAKTIEQIVGLLKKNPKGLRAEQIRSQLGLQAKEMPRPLAEAVTAKKLTKKGEKRATTYFAR